MEPAFLTSQIFSFVCLTLKEKNKRNNYNCSQMIFTGFVLRKNCFKKNIKYLSTIIEFDMCSWCEAPN